MIVTTNDGFTVYLMDKICEVHPHITREYASKIGLHKLNKELGWIYSWLHNPDGPAMVYNRTHIEIYALDGTILTVDDWEKEVKKLKFADKLEDLINE